MTSTFAPDLGEHLQANRIFFDTSPTTTRVQAERGQYSCQTKVGGLILLKIITHVKLFAQCPRFFQIWDRRWTTMDFQFLHGD